MVLSSVNLIYLLAHLQRALHRNSGSNKNRDNNNSNSNTDPGIRQAQEHFAGYAPW